MIAQAEKQPEDEAPSAANVVSVSRTVGERVILNLADGSALEVYIEKVEGETVELVFAVSNGNVLKLQRVEP